MKTLKKAVGYGYYGCSKELVKKNSNVKGYQFWHQNNHPIELWSIPMIKEKIRIYTQQSRKRRIGYGARESKHSSDRNYTELDSVIPLKILGF